MIKNAQALHVNAIMELLIQALNLMLVELVFVSRRGPWKYNCLTNIARNGHPLVEMLKGIQWPILLRQLTKIYQNCHWKSMAD